MPQKRVVKKTASKKTTKTPQKKSVEKVLVENFISLQKVMTNLAVKFDDLGAQISKLLELFEISAKTLAEKEIKINAGKTDTKEDGIIAEKLEALLDQNKIIARGLTLLHEPLEEIPIPIQAPIPQAPRKQMAPPMQMPSIQSRAPPHLPPLKQKTGEYQKSQKPTRAKSPKPAKKNETVF